MAWSAMGHLLRGSYQITCWHRHNLKNPWRRRRQNRTNHDFQSRLHCNSRSPHVDGRPISGRRFTTPLSRWHTSPGKLPLQATLPLLLNQSEGEKSSSCTLRRWHWALPTRYGQSRIFCSRPCSRWKGEIISCQYLIYWKYHIKKEFHYARQQ